MHPIVYEAFRTVLSQATSGWTSVLEVGTPRNPSESLLSIPILAQAERIGIDLSGPYKVGDVDVLQGNATKLPFEDSKFDLVLCNSVLEHEPKFWLVLAEMKRVLCPGGLLVIGVPAFSPTTQRGGTTPTLYFHAFPDDYYRFSPSAVRDVFLEGLVNTRQLEVMTPPRIVGWGRKPQ
jgi:SAM-dependent methyltransferase